MLTYPIRHAESLTNANQSGGLNSGLSPLGIRQAEALARRFRGMNVTALYSSPFRRCLETAVPIAKAVKATVRVRPELFEYHHMPVGTVVDLELDELPAIAARYPGAALCPDWSGPHKWPPVDEPLDVMVARMRAFAAHLKSRWTDADDVVVLVSHGSPIARLIEAWLTDQPGPSFRFVIDNGTVSALRHFEGTSSLVCLNDTSHLSGLAPPPLGNLNPDGSIKTRPSIMF